jgi:hypothetical protein
VGTAGRPGPGRRRREASEAAALRVAAAAAAAAEAIANLPRLSDGAVTNGRAAVLAVAGVASRQCGVRSGKAIGRPNHFQFHIFFSRN